jgi:hypothetical protein
MCLHPGLSSRKRSGMLRMPQRRRHPNPTRALVCRTACPSSLPHFALLHPILSSSISLSSARETVINSGRLLEPPFRATPPRAPLRSSFRTKSPCAASPTKKPEPCSPIDANVLTLPQLLFSTICVSCCLRHPLRASPTDALNRGALNLRFCAR